MVLKSTSSAYRTHSRTILNDAFIRAIVWSTWAFLTAAMVVVCLKFHKNIPYSEDWFLVAPLTGNEPHLGQWLWSLHHDHRFPLPKLLMLGLLKLTHGSFRAVAVFNVAALSATSAGFIVLARKQRGRTIVSDIFLPLFFLHPGNLENMLWSWEITFVTSVVLISMVLAILIDVKLLPRPIGAAVFGFSLALLPLTGATGLLFAIPMSLFASVLCWTILRERTWSRSAAVIYGASQIAIVLIVTAYFLGYHHSELAQPATGLAFVSWASAQVLALGFGPATRSLSSLSVLVVVGLIGCTVGFAISRIRQLNGIYRLRLAGLLATVLTGCLYAVTLSRGRALMAYSYYGGWPQRYCLLMAPVFISAYFIWDFCSRGSVQRLVQPALAGILVVLLPLNLAHGIAWIDLYEQQTQPMLSDLKANLPAPVIAKRNETRVFFDRSELERLIPALQNAGVRPFARTAPSLATGVNPSKAGSETAISAIKPGTSFVAREIRYIMSDAGQVTFVWGVDGWRLLPAEMRPPNTEVVDGLMQTAMTQYGDHFGVDIRVPEASQIDYGFLIRKSRDGRPVQNGWESGPSSSKVERSESLIEVNSALALEHGCTVYRGSGTTTRKTVRYHSPDAAAVEMDWGVNGWYATPSQIRPPGTTVENGVMKATMLRRDGYFTAEVIVPAESTLDASFLITRKRGWIERLVSRRMSPAGESQEASQGLTGVLFGADTQPIYVKDREYHSNADSSDVIDIWPALQLAEESSLRRIPKPYWTYGAALYLSLVLAMTLLLAWRKRGIRPEQSLSDY